MSQKIELLNESDVRKIAREELELIVPSKKEMRKIKEEVKLLKEQIFSLAQELIAQKQAGKAEIISDNTALSTLPFSNRVKWIFSNANLQTVEDLKQKTVWEMRKYRNCGNQSIREMEMVGKLYGFKLSNGDTLESPKEL